MKFQVKRLEPRMLYCLLLSYTNCLPVQNKSQTTSEHPFLSSLLSTDRRQLLHSPSSSPTPQCHLNLWVEATDPVQAKYFEPA